MRVKTREISREESVSEIIAGRRRSFLEILAAAAFIGEEEEEEERRKRRPRSNGSGNA